MSRREDLGAIFAEVDENEQKLIDKLLDEVVFLENQMLMLREMPFIHTHPRNPAIQKTTAAARQYKECSQSYMNAIRILTGILRQTDSSSQDELLKRLEEFSL